MPKIFLINVGANSSHRASARCPIFPDGRFVYVPFPLNNGWVGTNPYPVEAWPFTNGLTWHQTHADPDWKNLTYGDNLANARASALGQAEPGDILLFWALLWKNLGNSWVDFTTKQGWYLIGSLRIEEILKSGQSVRDARLENRQRASANAHMVNGRLKKACNDVVFLGDRKHSSLFDHAVPLITNGLPGSLLYRTFRTKSGEKLPLNGKPWSSFVRSCRAVWNTQLAGDLRRAEMLRRAILKRNDFDFLDSL